MKFLNLKILIVLSLVFSIFSILAPIAQPQIRLSAPTTIKEPLLPSGTSLRKEEVPIGVGVSPNERVIFQLVLSGPGPIQAEAIWLGTTKQLTLILNGPDRPHLVNPQAAYARADGSSPLSIYYNVTKGDFSQGKYWKVSVVNLTGKGTAQGTLKLSYPAEKGSSVVKIYPAPTVVRTPSVGITPSIPSGPTSRGITTPSSGSQAGTSVPSGGVTGETPSTTVSPSDQAIPGGEVADTTPSEQTGTEAEVPSTEVVPYTSSTTAPSPLPLPSEGVFSRGAQSGGTIYFRGGAQAGSSGVSTGAQASTPAKAPQVVPSEQAQVTEQPQAQAPVAAVPPKAEVSQYQLKRYDERGIIDLVEAGTGTVKTTLPYTGQKIYDVVDSPDGKRALIMLQAKGKKEEFGISIIDLAQGEHLAAHSYGPFKIERVIFTEDGSMALVLLKGKKASKIASLDLGSGKAIGSSDPVSPHISGLEIEGDLVIVRLENDKIIKYDINTLQKR